MTETLLIALSRLCCGVLVSSVNDDYRRGGVVYFANHTSHLDLLSILSVFPRRMRRRIRPVAAQDYWNATPFRRYVSCRVLHAILMDRCHALKTRECFSAMARALDAGDSLLIFPEGTRSAQETPGAFKGGIHHLAQLRPQTEFIPTALSGFFRTLPKGEFLPAPNIGRIGFGAALRLEPGEVRDSFLRRCRQALLDAGMSHQSFTPTRQDSITHELAD